MVGNPGRADTLRAANAGEARAIVADVDDETNPSVILAARVIDDTVPVLSVVRNHRVARHHEYAGATRVISARQSFARSLAMRVSSSYASRFCDIITGGDELGVSEIVVEEGSPLVGQTLREAQFNGNTPGSPRVIAAWVGGKFLISPDMETPIEKNSIFVVSGQLQSTQQRGTHTIPRLSGEPSRVIVAGYGQVGKGVVSVLEQACIETTIIDVANRQHRLEVQTAGDSEHRFRGTDVVGNVIETATLRQAQLEETDAVVLLLDDDITTIYATILIHRMAPDVQIIARAEKAESISTLYRAGADFILSLAEVTGEILASELLDLIDSRKDFIPASAEFELIRVDGSHFADQALSELALRRQTECTVVAVERDEQLILDLPMDFVVEPNDLLIFAGSKDAIRRLRRDLPADGHVASGG